MKQRIFFLIYFTCITLVVQSQIGMGQWRTHYSYNEMSQVESSPTTIYGLSDGALFSIEKEDNSLETYSKITGLNDLSASFIRYNANINALFIAYKNGNIDVLSTNGVDNIADIKNKEIAADKAANDILFVNENAYYSCSFGIVVVDLLKKEIKDTYIIGTNSTHVNVKSVAFLGDSIYALTSNGIYAALKTGNLLVDYNNWKSRTSVVLSSPANLKMLSYNNQLYLLKSNGEVYSSPDAINWSLFDNSQAFKGIRVSDNFLVLYSSYGLVKYNTTLSSETTTGLKIADVLYSESENAYWVASTDSSGIHKVFQGAIVQKFKPDGPATNKIFNVTQNGERLFALTGGKWEADYTEIAGAVMILEDNTWKNIVQKEVDQAHGIRPFIDLTHVAVDPTDKTHFYISTYGCGLFEFKNDVFNYRYSGENSGLENSENGAGWCIIDGIIFDENNNLWMCNDFTPATMKILKNDGNWQPLTYAPISNKNTFDKILITKNNFKWLNRPRGGGVFILDDKGNSANISSHRYVEYGYSPKVIDQDENILEFERVYSMAEDLNGSVWVGTLKGPVVFNDIDEVFNANYRVHRPKIPRTDGSEFADYLLDGEKITSIAVDGANRKWIGTASAGAYLMSEDGLETIQHFTTENSPILSNTILSIAIDQASGEVFFATDNGLISFMSDAAAAKESYATLSIYPNPVRENFTGYITIENLMENTTVKITDTAGNLVYQTKSNGGTATWNGYTLSGLKASTGVYFVMVSNGSEKNTENVKTSVGKILIIK